MKQRIVSLLLALSLACALALPAAAAGTYPDVPAGHWAAADIARATQLGLFRGDGAGRFGLGRPITRAEFVTTLARFFGWDTAAPDRPSFTDVGPGTWYYAPVETALAEGAIAATGPQFRPNDYITRGEMVSMLLRGMGYASLAGQAAELGTPFPDVTVNAGYITMAYDLQIVRGMEDGRFDSDGTAAREQAASVLVRAYDRWYGASRALDSGTGLVAVSVDPPAAESGAQMPVTPLEPMWELYKTLRDLRQKGQDMSQVVLCLRAGGVETRTSGGQVLETRTLSAQEVADLLGQAGVVVHYSQQYESAYLIWQPNDYQTATVWYQSPESLAAKLRMARMFDVDKWMEI